MVCVVLGLINFFVYTIFWACAFSADCRETVNGDWSKDMVASPPPTRPYDMKYMAVAGDDQFNCPGLTWLYKRTASEVECGNGSYSRCPGCRLGVSVSGRVVLIQESEINENEGGCLLCRSGNVQNHAYFDTGPCLWW